MKIRKKNLAFFGGKKAITYKSPHWKWPPFSKEKYDSIKSYYLNGEKKNKKGPNKAKLSKKQDNPETENFEQDVGSIEIISEKVSDINEILDNEKKKSTSRKTRKTKSSTKIDVVNLDSEKNKVKTKKTGWWNN